MEYDCGLPSGFINDAYYLIDNKRLLLKNIRRQLGVEEVEHFGVYTSHHAIVRRYRERFCDHYLPASIDARPIVNELRENAERLCNQLRSEDRQQEASILN